MLSCPRRVAASLLLPALLLLGCGSDSGADDTDGAKTAASGVTVSGAPGKKPSVKTPAKDAPTALKVEVLRAGDGEKIRKGDLLVANYLGQIWASNAVFDNSYDRGQPACFGIGVGQVIPGWDQGLVGQNVGSRVLLVIPPDLGYGEQGQPDAGIKGGDTLVFVVDLVDRFAGDLAASGTATQEKLPAGVASVSRNPGGKPELTVEKGAKPPAKPAGAVVVAGDGDALDLKKTLVAQVQVVDLASGRTAYETWGTAPRAVPVSQLPGLARALDGQKVGCRVVLSLPAQTGQGAVAVALDVVGTF